MTTYTLTRDGEKKLTGVPARERVSVLSFYAGEWPEHVWQMVREAPPKHRKWGVECMECGRKFQTASMEPKCPKCGSYDIEVA